MAELLVAADAEFEEDMVIGTDTEKTVIGKVTMTGFPVYHADADTSPAPTRVQASRS